ncbi:Acetylornithine aminotransferase, mitochondrial precursor [Globisporangium polare]
MLAALRSAVRGKQGLLRALPTTGASRAFAAVERPFVPEEYENKYMVKTYNTDGVRGEPNLLFTHGKGQYLYDAQGRQFLDFCAGIAVSGLGHSDPDWYKALVDAGQKICHTSNLFHTKAPLQLAKTLVDNSCFDKVFFCNSGTEANEGAYKFARLYANRLTKDTPLEGKKYEFISFKGGFHGRTAASLSLTHKPYIREAFMPLVPGIHHAEFNNIEDVKKHISDRTAGIFVEPVQGEGGVNPATPEFMRELRRLCDKHNALLIVDEVQCGLGRTGKLFGHENYDVTPDIMTLAKPLAGGLPIGAVLTVNKVAATVTAGSHGTTFGGNPLICAVANTVLGKIMDDKFLLNVQKRGRYLANGLKGLQDKYPSKVKEVREPVGPGGLFVGFECIKPVGPLVKYALSKGVMIISAGENTIRMCPPLVVTEEDIDLVVKTLDDAFAEDLI